MADYEVIAEGLAFPEGPVVMADGSVIVVEIHAQAGHPLLERAQGDRRRARRRAQRRGDRPGRGALCLQQRRHGASTARPPKPGRIERIDLATGKVERLYDSCDGKRLGAPNDLMFDCDGNMWFTDLGKHRLDGQIFRRALLRAARRRAITRIFGKAISYNGVGISPDMKTVYVADTYSGAGLCLRPQDRGAGRRAGWRPRRGR